MENNIGFDDQDLFISYSSAIFKGVKSGKLNIMIFVFIKFTV